MKTKACKKLHIQFGHPHTDGLHGLLKDAKLVDKKVFHLVADVEKAWIPATDLRSKTKTSGRICLGK